MGFNAKSAECLLALPILSELLAISCSYWLRKKKLMANGQWLIAE